MTDSVAWLRTPAAIRERAALVLRHVENGQSPWFALDAAGLEAAVQATLKVTRQRFRDPAKIPFHSRWRHFEVGGRDRWAMLAERMKDLSAAEIARRRIDLAVVSVLLDAGADPNIHDDKYDATALGWAEFFCNEPFAQLIRERGGTR